MNRLDLCLLGISSVEIILNFIIIFIYYFFRDSFLETESILELCKLISNNPPSLEAISERPFWYTCRTIAIIFFFIVLLLFPFTLHRILKELTTAKKRHLDFFTADSFHFYQWSHFLFYLILVSYLIVGSIIVYEIFIGGLANFLFYTPYFVVGSAGIGLGVFAYVSPEKFSKEIDFPKLIKHIEANKSVSKPEEKEDKYESYKLELETLLTNEKIYRDSNLNLASLAEKMNISTRHLSRIINQGYNKGFSDYINFYRVEEIKINLLAPEYQHYAILSIGLEAGFNSKSSFYSIFKKMTGQNPVQYKKEKIQKM